jgi:hypothetical protein
MGPKKSGHNSGRHKRPIEEVMSEYDESDLEEMDRWEEEERKGEELEEQLKKKQKGTPPTTVVTAALASSPSMGELHYCRVVGCGKLATHLCVVCVHFLCSEHEVSEHVDRSTHVRVSLEEQRIQREKEEKEIQLKRKETVAPLLEKFESDSQVSLATLNSIKSEWSNDSEFILQRQSDEKGQYLRFDLMIFITLPTFCSSRIRCFAFFI